MALAESAFGQPVRVVLVDGDELVLEGLRGMLSPHQEQVDLVGHTTANKDALRVATRLDADVVLLDTDIRGTGGLQLAAEMAEQKPSFRIVILTHDDDERHVFEVLQAGVSGYLLKSVSGEQLAEQLVRIRNGEVALDPVIATRIATRAARFGGGFSWPGQELGLSQRESEVLGLLVDGLSNQEIAAKLVLGVETIKTHLRSIYRKLNVRDRAQATAVALQQGIFA